MVQNLEGRSSFRFVSRNRNSNYYVSQNKSPVATCSLFYTSFLHCFPSISQGNILFEGNVSTKKDDKSLAKIKIVEGRTLSEL